MNQTANSQATLVYLRCIITAYHSLLVHALLFLFARYRIQPGPNGILTVILFIHTHTLKCVCIRIYSMCIYIQFKLCVRLPWGRLGAIALVRVFSSWANLRACESENIFSCFITPWKLASGFSIIENGLVCNGSPWCASNYMLESPSGLQPSASHFPQQMKGQGLVLWCWSDVLLHVSSESIMLYLFMPLPKAVGFLS